MKNKDANTYTQSEVLPILMQGLDALMTSIPPHVLDSTATPAARPSSSVSTEGPKEGVNMNADCRNATPDPPEKKVVGGREDQGSMPTETSSDQEVPGKEGVAKDSACEQTASQDEVRF